MRIRGTLATLIALSALLGACSSDPQRGTADRPLVQAAGPAAEKEPASGSADAREAADGQRQGGRKSDDARRKASRNRNERHTAPEQATTGSRPTKRQIQAAIANQGEQQVDDLPPRLKRLRAIGAARQGTPQKQRTMSPAEERAFERGTSDEYQNRHWAGP
jgi:hypothetical protein